jgi:hypothetical protein
MDQNGQITAIPIPADLIAAARRLPYEPTRYFQWGATTIFPEPPALVWTHFSPFSAKNAINRLQEAYDGHRQRRAPIEIAPIPDSKRFLVLDGNATASVAAAASWPTIPARLHSP